MIVDFVTYTDTDTVQSFIYQTALGVAIPFATVDSLRMQVRSDPADSTVYLEFTTINGLIKITNYAGGAFTITMPIAKLSKLFPGIYQHSLVWTDGVTFLRTEIWRGSLTHAAGPTRWTLGIV